MTWPLLDPRWPLPIPFVAAWTDETSRPVRLAIDANAGGRLAFFPRGRQGVGEPDFGAMDPSRQRDVVARRRCQVCVGPVGRRPLLIDVGEETASLSGADGRRFPCVREPWVCAPCLALALRLCRGIARERARGRLRVFRVFRWATLVTVARDSTSGADAVSYLKIVPTHFREVEPADPGRRRRATRDRVDSPAASDSIRSEEKVE